MSKIKNIFEDKNLVSKIQEKLPYLFQLAEENRNGNKKTP